MTNNVKNNSLLEMLSMAANFLHPKLVFYVVSARVKRNST
jgi:hypothetical protein